MATAEITDHIDERLDELYARKRSLIRLKEPTPLNYTFVFFASLLCLLAIYLPYVQYQFGFNDDYFALFERLRNADWIQAMSTQFVLQARPCEALLYVPQVAFVNHISDFVYVRGLGIVYLAGLATCFYSAFLSVRWSRWQAFTAAICLCAVPSFQVLLSWGTALQFVVPGIFAFAAWRTLRTNPEQLLGKILKYALAFLSLTLAVTIYQPTAMLFWVFVAIGMSDLETPGKDRLYFLLEATALAASAYAVDFAGFQIAKNHYGTAALLPGRSSLCIDVLGKIKWFLRNPLIDSLNFLRLQNSLSFALRSGAFIAVGMLLYVRGSIKYLGISLAVALFLIPMAYLPNLLVSESVSFFRTQTALSCLLTLYGMIAIKGILKSLLCRGRAFTLIAFASAILFGLVAYSNVLVFFAVPQSLELNLLRQQARGEFGAARAKNIMLFDRDISLAPFVRYDEFGMPSSAQEFDRKPLQVLLRLEALQLANPASSPDPNIDTSTLSGTDDSADQIQETPAKETIVNTKKEAEVDSKTDSKIDDVHK
jgi:hypothetical protein